MTSQKYDGDVTGDVESLKQQAVDVAYRTCGRSHMHIMMAKLRVHCLTLLIVAVLLCDAVSLPGASARRLV